MDAAAQQPKWVMAASTLACLAVVAQGLGILAFPGAPPLLAQWGTVAIPAILALLGLALFQRADPLSPNPILQWVHARSVGKQALWVMAWGAWVMFSAFAVQRHRSFHSNAFDLGAWHQMVWNTGHGHAFISSLMTWKDETWLAWHFSVSMALLAPLTWLSNGPEPLLVAQAALLVAGVFPVHRCAVRRVGDGALALCLAGAYLASPLLRGANNYEFHEICLSVPCVAWTLCMVDERRWWAAVPFIILGCLTKESTALALGGVAAAGMFRSGVTLSRRVGMLAWCVGMLAWFLACVAFICPAMGELSQEFFYLFRYDNLGPNLHGIISNLLLHPWRFLTVPLESAVKLAYLAKTLGSFGLLPLLAPVDAMAALPTFLMNTLGSYRPMHSVNFHYGAEMTPALAVAAAQGAHNLFKHIGNAAPRRRAVAYWLMACSLALYGQAEFAGVRLMPHTVDHEAVDALLETIPANAPVSCQTVLCPHVSGRRHVWLFPRMDGVEDGPDGSLTRPSNPLAAQRHIHAQYVVVDPSQPQPSYWQEEGKFRESLSALPSQGFVEVGRAGSVILYKSQQ